MGMSDRNPLQNPLAGDVLERNGCQWLVLARITIRGKERVVLSMIYGGLNLIEPELTELKASEALTRKHLPVILVELETFRSEAADYKIRHLHSISLE